MLRRVHTFKLAPGHIDLEPLQARHLRDALRIKVGDIVEVFDNAGATARAKVLVVDAAHVTLDVGEITPPVAKDFTWTVAAAIPKGQRADWMVEKLAELGTGRFVPLVASRSVTLPEGTQKFERWTRLATEAAKQSRRTQTMHIAPLTPVEEFVAAHPRAWYLSLEPDAKRILELVSGHRPHWLAMMIGPEGGWTSEELDLFKSAQLTAVGIGSTVLRVETAAVAAAAIVSAWA